MIIVLLGVLVLAAIAAALVAGKGGAVRFKVVAIFVALLLVGVPVLAVLVAIVGGTRSVHRAEVYYNEIREGVETHLDGHHSLEVSGEAPATFVAPYAVSAPQPPPQPPGAPWQVEPEVGASAGASTDDGEWFLKIDDPSVAREPHTSKQTLHAFVAERVAAACEQVGPGSTRRVIPAGHVNAVSEASRVIAERAGAALDGVSPPSRPADETWVQVRAETYGATAVSWWPERLERYTLVAEIVGPKGSAVVRAKLDEKPWLDARPAQSGRTDYIVVTSGPPAASKDQALRAVRHRVGPVVAERALARLRASTGAQPSHVDVRRQVEARYGQQSSATDTCLVAIDRPYGRVWFAASLIDVGRHDLDHLVAAAQVVHTHRKQSFARLVVALAGMLLVLGAVYAGLNALTRGYFRGQLRAAVVVAVAVAVAVVFLLLA